IYTIFLMMAGIGVPAFLVANLTAIIVGGVLGATMRRRRMQQEIAKSSGHVIVCGAGDTGEHCIAELLKIGRKIVVLDRDEERLKMAQNLCGQFLYLVGDAERDETLLA